MELQPLGLDGAHVGANVCVWCVARSFFCFRLAAGGLSCIIINVDGMAETSVRSQHLGFHGAHVYANVSVCCGVSFVCFRFKLKKASLGDHQCGLSSGRYMESGIFGWMTTSFAYAPHTLQATTGGLTRSLFGQKARLQQCNIYVAIWLSPFGALAL